MALGGMSKPRQSEGKLPASRPVTGPGGEGSRDSPTGEPASILARDLRNPLAVVISNLQLLADLVAAVQTKQAQESGVALDAGDWLTTRMIEAESCLDDARAAAERIRQIVAPKGQRAQSDRPPSLDTKQLRPARILIVDDEESVARAMQRIFRDYDTVVHTTAQDVLGRIILGERFDVILSDVGMPLMSGCDLYQEIRRIAPEQAERMIFVTGGSGEATEKAVAATGQPVLAKPFDRTELRTFIQKFLGKS
jgi:CheY-like chemotaxis protein